MTKKVQKDDTEIFQPGFIDEVENEKFTCHESQPSAADEQPTKEKHDTLFKITSYWIEFDPRLTETKRQTYSLLDLLGDIEGLFDGLVLFCGILVRPIAVYNVKSKILGHTFGKNQRMTVCESRSSYAKESSRKIYKQFHWLEKN